MKTAQTNSRKTEHKKRRKKELTKQEREGKTTQTE
jgi:hypothetical protein